jgi:hypothetical protein
MSIKRFLTAAVLFVLCGCAGGGGLGGGFNCPFNVPSCCYDSLFGCGTFDLPEGCSCSQYGFYSKENISALQYFSPAPKTASKNLSGTWRGNLKKQSSTCRALPAKVDGIVRIYDNPTSVSVAVPGYGTLRGGKSNTRGFKANGKYSSYFLACRADVSTVFTKSSFSRGTLQANVEYVCGGRVSCTAQYKGTITKI